MAFPKTRDEMVAATYKFSNHARCRSCQAEVEWWEDATWKKDAVQFDARPIFAGSYTFYRLSRSRPFQEIQMSRKRKAVVKPLAAATEALWWRSKHVMETWSAGADDLKRAMKMLGEALDDYSASISAGSSVQLMTCKECDGTCTQRRDGLCNRCFERTAPVLELQS